MKIRKVLNSEHFSFIVSSDSESPYWNARMGYVHVLLRIQVLRTFIRI